jgi:hypothetical protein
MSEQPPFLDMFRLPEDDRIKLIGMQLLDGHRLAVLLDAEGEDGMEKVNRYIQKIKRFCAPVNLEYKIFRWACR